MEFTGAEGHDKLRLVAILGSIQGFFWGCCQRRGWGSTGPERKKYRQETAGCWAMGGMLFVPDFPISSSSFLKIWQHFDFILGIRVHGFFLSAYPSPLFFVPFTQKNFDSAVPSLYFVELSVLLCLESPDITLITVERECSLWMHVNCVVDTMPNIKARFTRINECTSSFKYFAFIVPINSRSITILELTMISQL